jgi:hypothetical protein
VRIGKDELPAFLPVVNPVNLPNALSVPMRAAWYGRGRRGQIVES